MTISELKEYIYNENKIPFVLEQLGCHELKYNEQRQTWSAAQPDGDNPQGVNIRNNEHLNYRSFSRGIDYEDNKDLISLVESIKKISFVDALKYLHKILELPFEFKKQEERPKKKYDPLNVFKKVLNNRRRVVDVDDIHALDDKIMNDFIPLLHIDWVREGITERTRKKFGIAYSYRHKRIIIPHRYWATNDILAYNSRTTIENWEEFDIKKYYLSSGYNKAMNVYGYCENKDEIEKNGYCILYESEKSVLKRDSLCDSTGLALSGRVISDEQVRIILSLNIKEVVVSLDKDIPDEEVWHICEKFYRAKKVSYTKDFMELLGEKDSIADTTNKNFQFLFDNRIVYDEKHHQQYLRSLNK